MSPRKEASSSLADVASWLEQNLPALLHEYDVPGAAVAVSAGEESLDHAAGILNTSTGVDATPDSLFQVASVTKVWTATLVLQTVDEGALDLDAPIRDRLPEFRVADDDAARQISARHLLSHTAGFEGDILKDTGRGDDCIAKLVASLRGATQLFPPGQMFSYNNGGYCVLGRLVEVIRNKPYDDCLREHLLNPLQLTHAATGPDEAIMYRTAVGHIRPAPNQDLRPAPIWALPRAYAPAGSMLAMRPRDLLAFAKMHVRTALGRDDDTVLSPVAAAAMQERQVELPSLGAIGNAWGLGWGIFDWPGGPVIGHDGDTIGQSAYLRVVPSRDVAIVLLTNGGNARPIFVEIAGRVLHELAAVDVPPAPDPLADPPSSDLSRYIGHYSSEVADTTVS